MSKVLTFSTKFPSYHPKKGQPTYFVEKIYNGLYGKDWDEIAFFNPKLFNTLNQGIAATKLHTIRAGHRFKAGEYFSPRIWVGVPYYSKQIIIAPDIKIVKTWDFEMIPALWYDECIYKLSGRKIKADKLKIIAKNDGLNLADFLYWFGGGNSADSNRQFFKGQIICWGKHINYR